jgi:signal transduction histidine kinase
VLSQFIHTNRDTIIARTRTKLAHRPWPAVSSHELENGVPLFLNQLTDTLRLEGTATPFSATAIGNSAASHGADLLALGFSVSQVVHDYGDICQAITELAVEQAAPITNEEFHTLNRSLDTAIAEAVTEHARLTAHTTAYAETERIGQIGHELRNQIHTALLAFETLKRGAVAINGSTGSILGRCLVAVRDLVDTTLSEIRLAAGTQQRIRVAVAEFLAEISAAATLHADCRDISFAVDRIDGRLMIEADLQLLGSAVQNLLQNAFKFTPPGGHVRLRARRSDPNVIIEVADQCGGLPPTFGDRFAPFGDRRGGDRTGLGLGLSVARAAVRAHNGEIAIQNIPGKGCVFAITLPLALEQCETV